MYTTSRLTMIKGSVVTGIKYRDRPTFQELLKGHNFLLGCSALTRWAKLLHRKGYIGTLESHSNDQGRGDLRLRSTQNVIAAFDAWYVIYFLKAGEGD